MFALYKAVRVILIPQEVIMPKPLFQKVDCIMLYVPNLEDAIAFYRDRLGHALIWRIPDAAGLKLPGADTEIVLQTGEPRTEVDFLVDAADEAAVTFVEAGGSVVVPPFDIHIGRCVVVKDPWEHVLVMLDTSKGLLVTDEQGNVIGNAPPAKLPSPATPPDGSLAASSPANRYIDKLAWLHIVDGKILCAVSKGKDAYYLPGGKREPGETDHQALIREIQEELSVDLIPATIRFAGVFAAQAHGKPQGTIVRMTCYEAGYQGALAPASEIAAADWLSYADRGKCSLVVQIIFDWLRDQGRLA